MADQGAGPFLSVTFSCPGGHDVEPFSQTVMIGPNVTSQIVTIPISNDGQPGERDATIPVALSAPGSGASLGVANTVNLVIHDDNPFPPPVTVESVRWETIKVKVGNGKKARTKSETVLEIQFSGLVAGTGNLAAYQLSSVTTKKVKKTVVTSYKPIRLTSAVPASSPMTSMVSLLPATQAKPLAERSNPDRRGRPHRRLRPPHRRQRRRPARRRLRGPAYQGWCADREHLNALDLDGQGGRRAARAPSNSSGLRRSSAGTRGCELHRGGSD